MSKKNYSLLLFDVRVSYNGKCPEKKFYTKILEKPTQKRPCTFSHISFNGKRTLCGIDMENANRKFPNKWFNVSEVEKECENCLRIYNVLERELNKPCVGQLYRYEKTFEITKRGDIIERSAYRHLKMDSCSGCEKCDIIKEYSPSEFVFPANPIEGEIYQTKLCNGEIESCYSEDDDCGFYYVELILQESF